MKNIIDAPVCVNHVSKNEAKERAKKLLEQLGLSDKENAIHASFPAVSSSEFQ